MLKKKQLGRQSSERSTASRPYSIKTSKSSFSVDDAKSLAHKKSHVLPEPEPKLSLSNIVIQHVETAWKRSIDDYPSLAAYKFPSSKVLNCALEIFYAEPSLKGAPFSFVANNTIFVPDQATDHLERALYARKLAFERKKVVQSRDIEPAVMSQLRRGGFKPSL